MIPVEKIKPGLLFIVEGEGYIGLVLEPILESYFFKKVKVYWVDNNNIEEGMKFDNKWRISETLVDYIRDQCSELSSASNKEKKDNAIKT